MTQTKKIMAEEFDTLKREIENLKLKNQLQFERGKRQQETGDEKYNPFFHGVAWGHLKCLMTVMTWVRQTQKRIASQMEEDKIC